MSIEEAMSQINAAPAGSAHDVALRVIADLSAEDRRMAGPDLEEMALILDNS